MKIFTYQDYLKYQEFFNSNKENELNQLKEDSEEYIVENKAVNNEHDKIFRRILDNKKEAAKFINKTLELQPLIKKEEIEKYNSSFVTIELKNQECDVIFKMKKQNIFFLIEHQTKVDYTMPLRILEYSVAIIKSSIDIKKLNQKKSKCPTVIPIVLYTGKTKWNETNYINNVQEKLRGYENLEFGKYNVVDVNDYTEEELLQEESFLSKAMLIEKARHTNTLAINLEKIIQEVNAKNEVYTKEQKELLITIIELTLKKKLKEEESDELIKKLKKGDGEMLAVLEMIDEENERIFKNGKKEGMEEGKRKGKKEGIKEGMKKEKRETAKKMLERRIDIKTIVEVTELNEEEIKELAIKK